MHYGEGRGTQTQLSHFEPRPHHLHTPLTNKQKAPPHGYPTDAPDTKPATAIPDMLLTQLLADAPVTELAETVAGTGKAGTKGGMSGAKLAPRTDSEATFDKPEGRAGAGPATGGDSRGDPRGDSRSTGGDSRGDSRSTGGDSRGDTAEHSQPDHHNE